MQCPRIDPLVQNGMTSGGSGGGAYGLGLRGSRSGPRVVRLQPWCSGPR
jgi:hypothetical protein